MIDNKFSTIAQDLLLFIADTIEKQDIEGDIDVELQDGILNLELDQRLFIINKHSASKQIWLSSPISGPHHFSYILPINEKSARSVIASAPKAKRGNPAYTTGKMDCRVGAKAPPRNDEQQGKWTTKKGGELFELLEQELKIKFK
jgi:CyaY protein